MRKTKLIGMELSKIVGILNNYCQPHLADKWDNTGLLVEPSPPFSVKTIVVTNDLTEPVLDEAISKNANLIISYHPPIFSPIKRLTQNHWKERIIIRSLENRIAIYSPHTGLDAKDGGINDWLVSPFDLMSKQNLSPTPYNLKSMTKLTLNMTDLFGQFIVESGARLICSHIESSKGKLAEVTVPEELTDATVKLAEKMQIPIVESSLINKCKDEGYGRLVILKKPITLSEAIGNYKSLFGMENILVAVGHNKSLNDPVRVIAACAGSGGSVLCKTPLAWTADLFVTGELSHHERLDVTSKGISIILAGHSNSERGFFHQKFIPDLKSLLKCDSFSTSGDDVSAIEFLISESDREPGDFM